MLLQRPGPAEYVPAPLPDRVSTRVMSEERSRSIAVDSEDEHHVSVGALEGRAGIAEVSSVLRLVACSTPIFRPVSAFHNIPSDLAV